MTSETVRLFVDGQLSLPQFQQAVDSFVALIDTFAREADETVKVEWRLSKVTGGSFSAEGTAVIETDRQRAIAHHVSERYDRLGEALNQGRLGDEFSEPIQDIALHLVSLIGESIPEIRIGGNGNDWTISASVAAEEELADAKIPLQYYSKTSVRGQIVTTSSAHALYFTLRQAHTKKFIQCYPPVGWRRVIGESWTQSRWVIVEGILNRQASPQTMTEITDIVVLPESKPGDWRQAMGCLP